MLTLTVSVGCENTSEAATSQHMCKRANPHKNMCNRDTERRLVNGRKSRIGGDGQAVGMALTVRRTDSPDSFSSAL